MNYDPIYRAMFTINIAKHAVEASIQAIARMPYAPDDWAIVDATYWLCRAAQKAAKAAGDQIDPSEEENEPRNEEDNECHHAFYTQQDAWSASEAAGLAADNLAFSAQEAGHEIPTTPPDESRTAADGSTQLSN